MINIVARISDQLEVEKVTRSIDSAFLEALAANYANGDVSNITYYTVTSEEETRINSGDEYQLIWSGSVISGIDFSIEDNKPLLSITLSTDQVPADCPADLILANVSIWQAQTYNQGDYVFNNDKIYQCAVETTIDEPTDISSSWNLICSATKLVFTMYQSDNTTIDQSFNKTVFITVNGLGQELPFKCKFVNGICEKLLAYKYTSDCGIWKMPAYGSRKVIKDTNTNEDVKIRTNITVDLNIILPF